MIFNSFEFAVFLPVVFLIYWWIGNKSKFQNLFLVFVSYVFYGWWDTGFATYFISTAVDYYIAKGLTKERRKKKRKLLLYISITVNLGILVFQIL